MATSTTTSAPAVTAMFMRCSIACGKPTGPNSTPTRVPVSGVTDMVTSNAPLASLIVVFAVSHCVTLAPATGLPALSMTWPATRSDWSTRVGTGAGAVGGDAAAVGDVGA